ncbi:MAG: carboxypeptidase regulatory-like domain-containing protein [Oscillospiraceae bacterium]|nr:carboxypeptidase regulatory-like domain-containing protein [Oscillospiraceae bacterium]
MTEFYFKPSAGECVCTQVKLTGQSRGAIAGVVTDGAGEPVKDAMVILAPDGGELLEATFTQGDGSFYFGPLEDRLYNVRVVKGGVKLRRLELDVE